MSETHPECQAMSAPQGEPRQSLLFWKLSCLNEKVKMAESSNLSQRWFGTLRIEDGLAAVEGAMQVASLKSYFAERGGILEELKLREVVIVEIVVAHGKTI